MFSNNDDASSKNIHSTRLSIIGKIAEGAGSYTLRLKDLYNIGVVLPSIMKLHRHVSYVNASCVYVSN